MIALVTGANGFLGSALVAALLRSSEYFVRCIVRTGSAHDGIKELKSQFPSRCEILYGSLNHYETCVNIIRDVDIVFHLASAKSGAPAEMFQGSSVATKQLLDAIVSKSRGIKLVHCSSFSVYGVAGLAKGTLIDENTPLENTPHKRDLYAYSKWHQEKIVAQYIQQYSIPAIILRPGVIYGPGGSPMSSRVGLNLFGLFLFIGGKNVLPLTHVSNCADAFLIAAKNGRFNGDTYNVVDDQLITASEYIKKYRNDVNRIRYMRIPYWLILFLSSTCEWYYKKSGGQLPEVFTRYKTANMWKGNKFNNDKLKHIGWSPSISISDGMNRYFAFLKTTLGKPE